MLLDEFMPVLQVETREELLAEAVSFTRRLGFATVDAMVVIDHLRAEPEFVWVNNAPAAYRDLAREPDAVRHDPVMQHCKRKGVPIIWNQGTYTSAGQGAMWEVQARFGYCTGITFALHLPEGRHFCIGVDRDQALPASQAEVARMTADLQLFAVHAQDAAMRVLIPPSPPPGAPKLTARERESLCWTMDGKTAWEIGAILGVSEQTAARHVNNATRKLGCVNKLQAVVKALRLGLIH